MTSPFRRTGQRHALALAACLVFTAITFPGRAAGAAPAQATVRFDLPTQPLDLALVAFGELTGYSVLVSSELAQGRMAAAVCGDFTPTDALGRLLEGTRLRARFSGANAFTLQPQDGADAPATSALRAPSAAPATLPAYAEVLQRSLTRALCRLDPDAFGRYRLAFQLWLDRHGKVRKIHLLEPSGVAQRDRAVVQRLGALTMDGAPPASLPQPLTILLTPRSDPAGDCLPYLHGAG